MRITVFTSNNTRHNYYINLLANYCDELFVVQECMTKFPGKLHGHYYKSKTVEEYFSLVQNAQKKIFSNDHIRYNKKCKINYFNREKEKHFKLSTFERAGKRNSRVKTSKVDCLWN